MDKKVILIGALLIVLIGGIWLYTENTDKMNDSMPMVEVKVPINLSDVANVSQGELAFNESCAACHGKNGAGREGSGPPLIHRIYEPGHHGDMSFIIAAKNGVRAHHWKFGNMPPVEGIDEIKVKMIITYIRALQQANGIN